MSKVEKANTHTQQMLQMMAAIQKQMEIFGLCIQELEVQLKAKDAMIASIKAQATANTATATPAKQNNLTAASKHAPTSTPKPTPTPTTYASMAKKNTQAKKPTKAKAVLKAQPVCALQEPTRPSAYKFVYVPCCHHLKYGQVCKMLGLLKIQQSHIINIHFLARV